MAIGGDLSLLKFDTYSDYLKSFTHPDEYKYLGNKNVIQTVVKLGYRTNVNVYEEEDFYIQKDLLDKWLNPKATITELFSNYLNNDDPALVALAAREVPNICKKLSTIIFLQIRKRNGFDISGYIDYAGSLHGCSVRMMGATNWRAVFEGRQLLRPKRSHLSYYDCQANTIHFNNSENYEIMHQGPSLMFKHIGDHKIIRVKPSDGRENAKRYSFKSPLYGTVVLYDHHVRKAS